MSRIALNKREETIISLITNAGERWGCCRPETVSNTPMQETLESGTIGSIRVAPPGLRSVRQLGKNRGLEDAVYDDGWKAVLSQCSKCENCLGAHG